MLRSEIDDVVRTMTAGLRPARSGWSRTRCPFCITRVSSPDRRGSFAFYHPFGYFKCFRCAIRGVLGGYVTEHKVDDFANDRYRSDAAPTWYMSSTTEDAITSLACRPGIEYAESRGFDLAIRAETGLGLCLSGKYGESLIVPHVDAKSGAWWGFTARKWYARCSDPYRYPDGMTRERLFNDAALEVETDEPALMMEGVLDGLLYWPDAVGGLGKPIEDHVEVLKKTKRPICVVLDGDAWKAGEYFMMRLRLEKIPAGAVRMPPGRDPNDKQVDPRDIRRAALESLKSPRALRIQEVRR